MSTLGVIVLLLQSWAVRAGSEDHGLLRDLAGLIPGPMSRSSSAAHHLDRRAQQSISLALVVFEPNARLGI
jgi:hypothetical protein